MSSVINGLVQSIFQKNSLDDCSIHEIKQLAERYPYFAAPQLLLARKLKEEKSKEFDSQFQKAVLYFPNSLWMDHLLNEKGNAVIEPKNQTETEVAVEIMPVDNLSGAETNLDEPIGEMETEPGPEIPTLTGEVLTEEQISIEAPEPVSEITHSAESLVDADQQHEPEIKMPSFTLEPIDAATAELSFQPYHTVDYFASMGIKFREEEKPKDKFDQQLKSFTEWLKVIRKVPSAEIAAASSRKSEEKVEQLAEVSISEREVVTEAMAEVWEKQGNPEKAIAIYRKLSLLNPSKSSYFAGLIEHLKKS
jgi:tetratricopeptide (TPR) repeat protein